MDLGDKKYQVHILDKTRQTIKTCHVNNTKKAISEFFSQYPDAGDIKLK